MLLKTLKIKRTVRQISRHVLRVASASPSRHNAIKRPTNC